ncbi:ATP-binding cassette domain-containing protein [Streptomyces sp. NPDC059524]|uniref:ATP-binding cassette domain-containing protein n=1 Tax=Streptomyces sp. NPDC059524 TaxID=3346856 RepID=UPI0036BB776C
MGSEYAIHAEDVRKRYGDAPALSGFDLRVPAGTVHGLLGHNGAGKTTAVRILATLAGLDGGRAEVAGFDVTRQAAQVRSRIGLLGQYAAVDEVLSGRQNLVMFGRLFHLGKQAAGRRADELLAQFGLADTGDKQVKDYSGGMRRRLDLAASLILAPRVLFLDEPTTGLDPRSRNEVWEAVRSLVDGGTTVLLTTQYLDEADQLADSVSVIASPRGEGGRVIAEGTPDQLKSAIGGDRIDITLRHAADLGTAAGVLASVTGRGADVDEDNRRVGGPVDDRVAALTGAARALQDSGIDVEDIALRRPTLDEVFLHLTGEQPAEQTAEQPGERPADEKEVTV